MSDCGAAQWTWNEEDGLGGVRAAAAYIVARPACRAVNLAGPCQHRATGRGGGLGTAWCVGPCRPWSVGHRAGPGGLWVKTAGCGPGHRAPGCMATYALHVHATDSSPQVLGTPAIDPSYRSWPAVGRALPPSIGHRTLLVPGSSSQPQQPAVEGHRTTAMAATDAGCCCLPVGRVEMWLVAHGYIVSGACSKVRLVGAQMTRRHRDWDR